MAGNFGKYVDRAPIICAAGKVSGDPNDTVASTFKQYKVVDEIEALKHDAKIWEDDEFVPPRVLPPIQNAEFKGTNTEISEVLRPPVQTRYQQLISDLKDTPYSSFWNAQLGKISDPVPGLPMGMNPEEVIFGKPTLREFTVKELVSPSKGPYQVLTESQIGHEMYRKTHNDYNPSESINRGYYQPPYDPYKCFGEKTKYDPRGIWVKCACDWYKKEPLVHASKFQADYLNRSRPQLGKVLAPNNNIECVPKGHAFGDSSKQQFYAVEDLLKDPNVQPCVFKRDFNQWLSSLNKFRVLIKERCKKGFCLRDFFKNALYFDKEKTGWLPIDVFYELCACKNITFSKNDIEALCNHLKYTVDGKINYRKFIDLMDINNDLSDIKPVDDLPEESKYYISTYQAASCDYLIMDNTDMPPAGIPSIRYDLPRPVPAPGRCRADLENFGDETSAKAVVNPSIYTNYGLTYRDFFMFCEEWMEIINNNPAIPYDMFFTDESSFRTNGTVNKQNIRIWSWKNRYVVHPTQWRQKVNVWAVTLENTIIIGPYFIDGAQYFEPLQIQPRPPQSIRTLFEKLGYNFPGDSFQKLWELGVKIDQTGLVCVDTFKRLLQTKCPPLKLRVDEKQIECEKGVL